MICLQTVKWLQVLLFNTNYLIQHYSFICTQSNDSEYGFLIPIFQLRHTDKEFQVLLFNTNNSIQHYTIFYAQLDGSKNYYVSLRIQLNISHSFTHS